MQNFHTRMLYFGGADVLYWHRIPSIFPLAEAGGADYNVLLWLWAVWPQQEQQTASSEDALRCRTVKIAIGGDPYLKQ